jgi:hypothetical protein
MALSQILDLTARYNAATSNDANAIEGASDGSAVSATNFTVVQGTNLATSAAASTLAATGLMRFGYIGKFLQIDGGGTVTCDKVLVRLFKIN